MIVLTNNNSIYSICQNDTVYIKKHFTDDTLVCGLESEGTSDITIIKPKFLFTNIRPTTRYSKLSNHSYIMEDSKYKDDMIYNSMILSSLIKGKTSSFINLLTHTYSLYLLENDFFLDLFIYNINIKKY